MADERDPRDDAEDEGSAGAEVVHDDIVKRLLDYQRQLRETRPDAEAPAATATITAEVTSEEIVDLTGAEAEDDDTISLDEPATAATTQIATTEVVDAVDADDDSADVIVLHPETPTAGGGAPPTTSPALASTIAEVAAAQVVASTESETLADGGIGDADATEPTDVASISRSDAAHVTAEAATTSAGNAERIARYERSLEDLAERFATLRQSFQDMAIAADERLAEIEELLAQTQLDR